MSVPDPRTSAPATGTANSPLIRIAMWVAIGALIAAAIVCVIWVLVGSQNGIIGRAFLTILLLAAFAAAAMLDARLASRRPAWFALASMVVWVATLLIGAFFIWAPEREFSSFGGGFGRFGSFLLIILILQLALLHIRLFTKAVQADRQPVVTIIGYITMGLVVLLAVMLVVPLTFNEWIDFRPIYWRLVVAVTILAAVGTAIVPLIKALLSPRRAATGGRSQPPPGWPTYVDGATPLPVLPDGSPDWNAYYTGYPSAGAVAVPAPTPAQPANAPQWGQPAQPQQWGAQPPQNPWAANAHPEWAQPQPAQAQWALAPQAQQQWALQPQSPGQSQWAAPPSGQQPASGQQPTSDQPPPRPEAAPTPAPAAAAPAPDAPPAAAPAPDAARPTQQPALDHQPPPPPGYEGYPPPPPPPPR